MTNTKKIEITGPLDLLTTIPHLIGYEPDEELIIIALKDKSDSVLVSMALDLPNPAETIETEFVTNLQETITRAGAEGIVVVFYVKQNPEHYLELVSQLQILLNSDIHIRDILWVSQDHWASYICQDLTCCPLEGRVLDKTKNSLAQVELVLAGRGLQDKGEISAWLSEYELDEEIESQIQELQLKQLQAQKTKKYTQWQKRIFKYLINNSLTSKKAQATLLLGLSDIAVRDALLAHHIEKAQEGADLHIYLVEFANQWAKVVKNSSKDFKSAICCCISAFLWQAGEGVLARSALNTALSIDPSYRLAKLLESSLDSGMPPWQFRDAFTKISNPWG